ncbi:threonine/serine exporter ThrE family protein [Corynebacterium choanae]|uniref:Amino acid export carrier protein n=1 Tax=Corynebacterium choanae TaxID=1862358 RepID=A0A3G6J4C0_9CORY|nr:threonine/serine exporter family protein [Corynebacterium choanae]AZA12779.1 hypothetical protein CCHOA_01755 [Corynebacterium choanae]
MARRLTGLLPGWGKLSTVDQVAVAPPPSPLAPVDLTDPLEVAAVMDLAARIGDVLLASGTGNTDARTQIHAVASAYGLHYCHVDITFNTITVFTHVGATKGRPISVFRVVRKLSLDFSKLQDVDRLIRRIQAGQLPPFEAEQNLDRILQAKPPYGYLVSLLGWAIMAAAVAVLLGGNLLVTLISLCSAAVIMHGFTLLGKQGLPDFFKNIFGGIVATVPAAITYQWAVTNDVDLTPSQIVASGIVVMLAGLTLVQSLQDGITGAPVTASARFFDTILLTGGIIAGVGIGIQLAGALDISLPPLQTQAIASAGSLAKVLSGAVASAGFAIALYARWSSVLVAGVTALIGSGFYYYVFIPQGFSPVIGLAAAATIIGLIGGLLARRFAIPPLITAVSGITPLLPGLAIYRGMYAVLHDQILLGFSNLALALAIGSALAAGVVLGEWMARKIRRPRKTLNFYKGFRRPRTSVFEHSTPAADTTATAE